MLRYKHERGDKKMFVGRQIDNERPCNHGIQPIKRAKKAMEKPCKKCSSPYSMSCFTTCARWDRYSMMKKM